MEPGTPHSHAEKVRVVLYHAAAACLRICVLVDRNSRRPPKRKHTRIVQIVHAEQVFADAAAGDDNGTPRSKRPRQIPAKFRDNGGDAWAPTSMQRTPPVKKRVAPSTRAAALAHGDARARLVPARFLDDDQGAGPSVMQPPRKKMVAPSIRPAVMAHGDDDRDGSDTGNATGAHAHACSNATCKQPIALGAWQRCQQKLCKACCAVAPGPLCAYIRHSRLACDLCSSGITTTAQQKCRHRRCKACCAAYVGPLPACQYLGHRVAASPQAATATAPAPPKTPAATAAVEHLCGTCNKRIAANVHRLCSRRQCSDCCRAHVGGVECAYVGHYRRVKGTCACGGKMTATDERLCPAKLCSACCKNTPVSQPCRHHKLASFVKPGSTPCASFACHNNIPPSAAKLCAGKLCSDCCRRPGVAPCRYHKAATYEQDAAAVDAATVVTKEEVAHFKRRAAAAVQQRAEEAAAANVVAATSKAALLQAEVDARDGLQAAQAEAEAAAANLKAAELMLAALLAVDVALHAAAAAAANEARAVAAVKAAAAKAKLVQVGQRHRAAAVAAGWCHRMTDDQVRRSKYGLHARLWPVVGKLRKAWNATSHECISKMRCCTNCGATEFGSRVTLPEKTFQVGWPA